MWITFTFNMGFMIYDMEILMVPSMKNITQTLDEESEVIHTIKDVGDYARYYNHHIYHHDLHINRHHYHHRHNHPHNHLYHHHPHYHYYFRAKVV